MFNNSADMGTGSSPLTRGKRVGVTLDVWRRGLIPAHAGKTCVCMSTGLGWSAHPRSRGENVFDGARNTHPCGSSPLTRGKPYYLVQHMQHGRLIPAHAGKTMFRRASSVGTSAHPRSRGENKAVSTLARKHVGSSPLTRGKRPGPTRGEALTGLIPAHAGKTVSTVASIGWQTAHPRSRGENLPHGRKGGAMTGSSPLTRGKRTSGRTARRSRGLIPAHAGKTLRLCRRRRGARAHPRSRGENNDSGLERVRVWGSSPLKIGRAHV